MTPYKHLFFDLDNTLVDFRANAREAFEDIFGRMDLTSEKINPELFLNVYEKYNEYFWTEYRNGRVKKEVLRSERFILAFQELGINDQQLALKVSDLYMELAPQKSNLFDHVIEVLTYLKNNYRLYLLTNGFTEIQLKKIDACHIQPYFSKLFIAEIIGYQKPHRNFFEYAVKSIHAHKNECIMIGDDPVADIEGAKNAGIDQVFFNPNQKQISFEPTYEITDLQDLIKIL